MKEGQSMFFEPFRFIEFLKYMGVGMLGVFIIIGIIIAATYAIGRLKSGDSDSK